MMSEEQLQERERFVAFRREHGIDDLATNYIEQLVAEVRRLRKEREEWVTPIQITCRADGQIR